MAGTGRSHDIAAANDPFEQDPARSVGSLLVVGDNTAAGAGAAEPGQSVAGRLGKRFPGLRIRNLAVAGARLGDVARQLDSIGRERFGLPAMSPGCPRAISARRPGGYGYWAAALLEKLPRELRRRWRCPAMALV